MSEEKDEFEKEFIEGQKCEIFDKNNCVDVDVKYKKAISLIVMMDTLANLEETHPFSLYKREPKTFIYTNSYNVKRNGEFLYVLEKYSKVDRTINSLLYYYVEKLTDLNKKIFGDPHLYLVYAREYEEFHKILTNFDDLTKIERELIAYKYLVNKLIVKRNMNKLNYQDFIGKLSDLTNNIEPIINNELPMLFKELLYENYELDSVKSTTIAMNIDNLLGDSETISESDRVKKEIRDLIDNIDRNLNTIISAGEIEGNHITYTLREAKEQAEKLRELIIKHL